MTSTEHQPPGEPAESATEPVEVPAKPAAPTPPPPAVRRPVTGPAGPQWWRARPGVIALIVLGILVIILIAVVLDNNGSPAPGGAPVNGNPADHAVSAPRAGLTDSAFELLSGAASVTVRTADIGGDLYRASTPLDSGQLPKVINQNGRVQLQLVNSGPLGATALDVQLSNKVKWSVRMSGGATSESLQLATGKVSAVDIVTGATNIDVSLPKPTGTVPVRISGGASELTVHTPAGVAARVTANSGAGQIIVYGANRQGVAAGTVLTSPGWATASNRYDVQLLSGVGVVTVAGQ
jgi:hypothetical protein